MDRRGTKLEPANRFLPVHIDMDEYCSPDADHPEGRLKTEWYWDDTRTIVTQNESPDVPFRYSINPYRGCEHGCAYCYARTYHEYLGWNAGSDFESKILVKSNAANLLREWLCQPRWDGQQHMMLSGVTDPYQPIERKLKITRQLLEVLCEAKQAVSLITKNAMITRDIDLLSELARHHATGVCLSITSLDKELAMMLEPRCSVPDARLRAICELASAGIPVHVNMAPIIPGLNDHEIPQLLEAVAKAGAKSASWILLRLPGAVESIFVDWLERNRPLQKDKILGRLQGLRNGQLSDSKFGRRMRGEGFFSDQWSQLFDLLRKKHGLAERQEALDTSHFRPTKTASGQQFLF